MDNVQLSRNILFFSKNMDKVKLYRKTSFFSVLCVFIHSCIIISQFVLKYFAFFLQNAVLYYLKFSSHVFIKKWKKKQMIRSYA